MLVLETTGTMWMKWLKFQVSAIRPARRLSRITLAEVVEPRFEELFTLVQAELHRNGLEE